MDNIILKIEETINVVLPFVCLVLGAVGLSNVLPQVETVSNIILAALGTAGAVIHIWAYQIYKKIATGK